MSAEKKDNDDIFKYPIARVTGAYVSEITNDLVCISPLFYAHACWLYKVRPTYILLDCVHKGVRAYEADSLGNGVGDGLVAVGDRYVWHLLASVLLPSVSLNYLRMGVNKVLGAFGLAKDVKTSLITIAVLGAIPLIVQPLDQAADHILDHSYRQIYMNNADKSSSSSSSSASSSSQQV